MTTNLTSVRRQGRPVSSFCATYNLLCGWPVLVLMRSVLGFHLEKCHPFW